MASETPQEEVVSLELPAPHGWKKQFFPKRGGTPRKSEIVFTSPTGEAIHNQRQLQQYLKAHPGGPPTSEFDWGTGETPRRSARLSEKTKAAPATPESDPPTKRRRSSISKKDIKDNGTAPNEETKAQEVELKSAEKDVQTQEDEKTGEVKASKGSEFDVQMQQAQDAEKIEPQVMEEVAKENNNEPKESASVESKAGEDTIMSDAVTEKRGTVKDDENASVENAKADAEGEPGDAKQTEDEKGTSHENNLVETEKPKAEEQAQSGPKLQDGLQEPMKPDTSANVEVELNVGGAEDNGNKPDGEGESGDAKQTEDEKGTSHENNLVENEKPRVEEQAQSGPKLEDGLPEPVKPDTSANVEVEINVGSAEKDNRSKPGTMEEPKGDDLIKDVEVTGNGSEAS